MQEERLTHRMLTLNFVSIDTEDTDENGTKVKKTGMSSRRIPSASIRSTTDNTLSFTFSIHYNEAEAEQ